MRSIKILAIVITAFICTTVTAQEKVYMPYFEVINMHKDYSLSASRLFKLYAEQADKYQIVLPEKFDTLAPVAGFEKVKATAATLQAPCFCTGEINRLGEMAVVVISLYKTQDGTKIWTGTLKALQPEDLDPVMNRLASGMNNKTKVGDTEDIYNVTNYDGQELNKITANGYFGAEIGGALILLSDVGSNLPAGFGILLTRDVRTIIVDLKGEFYFGDIDFYGVSISLEYPLINKRNTPFISGGLGYSGVSVTTDHVDAWGYHFNDEQNNAGLTFYFGGGYLFNRNSDVNIRINPSFFFSGYKICNQYPAGLLINIAMLF
jgi:hypothetical protein